MRHPPESPSMSTAPTSSMDEKHIEAERAKFEADCVQHVQGYSNGRHTAHLERTGHGYQNPLVHARWQGWQARATQESAPADVLEEAMALSSNYGDQRIMATRGRASRDDVNEAADALRTFLARHLRPAPAAQQAPAGWLSIESVPHETEVLVWFGPSVGVKSATYTDPHGDGVMFWCVTDEKFDPHPVRRFCAPYPTHWMPLPAAPQQQGGGNG